MPRCPKCGLEVVNTDNFCRYCGADLKALSTPEQAVKAVLERRIDGIKRKSAEAIRGLVDEEHYTKFDDWPPFERQGLEALKREAEAFQVLAEYDYQSSDWRIDLFEDSASASFTINYGGTIRGRPFNIRSRVTAFLVKAGGNWKLVHEHWSRFPDEQRRGVFRRRFPW